MADILLTPDSEVKRVVGPEAAPDVGSGVRYIRSMHKTLVIRACAIGDFVLNLPALRAVHEMRNGVKFTLVGYPATLELARKFVAVEALHSIESDPWRRLFFEPVAGLTFDSAIVWMKDPAFAGNLRLSGIADVHRADPFPAFGHAAMHLLRTLGLPAPRLPDLWSPATDRIVLQPGSGSPRKCWPHFGRLAAEIANASILLGPAEGAAEPASLAEVSDLLVRSRAYIGNDSGITHLAAYLGVPTLALFGPTDPRVWGPLGRRARIIWKARLEDISVDEVLRAAYDVARLKRGDSAEQDCAQRIPAPAPDSR
jgi:ADP-heptose:LPS heptosyltransferase